jgi:glycosyltransferase involved in cell wall biosynthesis
MEAMACGLPAVVTRIPGNLEWVSHGKNGFLVPPGDRVMLARYLSILLGDDELRARMRMANIELATARFDWKLNSLIFEKCVSDLLGSRPAKKAR